MNQNQFKLLYREFLFRMVDRELLPAQADSNQLLGRFAAFLIWISLGFTLMVGGIQTSGTREAVVLSALPAVQLLISTTMLIVALFAVLSWDSIFPDRRDVYVLTPLPVSTVTIVAAKTAALAAALGAAVAVFNAIPGTLLTLVVASAGTGILGMLFSVHFFQTLIAFWLSVALSAAFVMLCVICIQAIAAQLPRPLFLRLTSILQIATFCFCVGTYFLQPPWTPAHWFTGMFRQLNGFPDAAAGHAWQALAITSLVGGCAWVLCCFRILRKIAEQPDIAPVRSRRSWSLPLGSSLHTAITQFSLRSLIRSRQHRVLVAFYFGVGFAIVILFLRTGIVRMLSNKGITPAMRAVSLPLIGSSYILLICWIAGIRAAFAIPVDLRANWIFRIAYAGDPKRCIGAGRTAFFGMGLLPFIAVATAVFFWLWPLNRAAQHLLILALLGTALSLWSLRGFHKIPFTCSYLPGKTNIHMTLAASLLLGLNITFWLANFERYSLFEPRKYVLAVALWTGAAALGWWTMRAEANSPDFGLRFNEEVDPEVMSLGLYRDGVLPEAELPV